MQLRAENQNLVSALSNYQQILYQFFDFTQNLKQSLILIKESVTTPHSDIPVLTRKYSNSKKNTNNPCPNNTPYRIGHLS